MRVGVVCFPGSNCEHDVHHALGTVLGAEVEYVWHKSDSVDGLSALVLAGGFSYGDYLRTGAIARFSPIMEAVERFAADGGSVLGICNGFQILVEAGMLPGALLRNRELKFRCQDVLMRVEHANSPFTCSCEPGQILRMNMAHYEGSYYADPQTLQQLETNGQVVLRFCDPHGNREPSFNPNGSINDIAAVSSADGRVLGLMPHPERSMESALGSTDGRYLFGSMLRRWNPERRTTTGAAEASVRPVTQEA